jgi:DNA-binding MarR family transcriptional regulator
MKTVPRRLSLIPGVHRATHRIGIWLEEVDPPLAVTQGEAHLLAHLTEAGACSVGELHRAFAHKRSSLTSYLDRLEARGHIVRAPHPGDRRSFLVSLTPAGSAAAARVHRRLSALETAALEHVGAGQVRAFRAVLQILQEASESPHRPSRHKKRGTS